MIETTRETLTMFGLKKKRRFPIKDPIVVHKRPVLPVVKPPRPVKVEEVLGLEFGDSAYLPPSSAPASDDGPDFSCDTDTSSSGGDCSSGD